MDTLKLKLLAQLDLTKLGAGQPAKNPLFAELAAPKKLDNTDTSTKKVFTLPPKDIENTPKEISIKDKPSIVPIDYSQIDDDAFTSRHSSPHSSQGIRERKKKAIKNEKYNQDYVETSIDQQTKHAPSSRNKNLPRSTKRDKKVDFEREEEEILMTSILKE
jgi:hypothetical protein